MRYLRCRHSELNAARRDPGESADLAGKTRSQLQQRRGRLSSDSNEFPPIARMVRSAAAYVGNGNEGQGTQDGTRQQAAAND